MHLVYDTNECEQHSNTNCLRNRFFVSRDAELQSLKSFPSLPFSEIANQRQLFPFKNSFSSSTTREFLLFSINFPRWNFSISSRFLVENQYFKFYCLSVPPTQSRAGEWESKFEQNISNLLLLGNLSIFRDVFKRKIKDNNSQAEQVSPEKKNLADSEQPRKIIWKKIWKFQCMRFFIYRCALKGVFFRFRFILTSEHMKKVPTKSCFFFWCCFNESHFEDEITRNKCEICFNSSWNFLQLKALIEGEKLKLKHKFLLISSPEPGYDRFFIKLQNLSCLIIARHYFFS